MPTARSDFEAMTRARDGAAHGFVDLDGRDVRAGVVEPAAHGGVEGEVKGLEEDLAIFEI